MSFALLKSPSSSKKRTDLNGRFFSLVDLLGRLSRSVVQDLPRAGIGADQPPVTASPPRRQPQARHRHLSAVDAARLVERYRAGVRVNDLAANYKIHRATVMAHLRRAGVPKYSGWTEETTAEAKRLRAQGLTIAEVAVKLGRSRSTVQRRLKPQASVAN